MDALIVALFMAAATYFVFQSYWDHIRQHKKRLDLPTGFSVRRYGELELQKYRDDFLYMKNLRFDQGDVHQYSDQELYIFRATVGEAFPKISTCILVVKKEVRQVYRVGFLSLIPFGIDFLDRNKPLYEIYQFWARVRGMVFPREISIDVNEKGFFLILHGYTPPLYELNSFLSLLQKRGLIQDGISIHPNDTIAPNSDIL